jgi:hypothetical protein
VIEESIDPTVRTVPSLLAEAYVRLLSELLSAEAARFRAESNMPTPKGETATLTEEDDETRTVLASVLDELMTNRLSTNRNEEPLLHPSDADRVVQIVFKGAETDENTAGSMAVGRAVVSVIIAERINFLRAIDNHLYTAFDKFVSALMGVSIASGHFYSPVVDRVEARNAIYRACMTPDSWQRRTTAAVALLRSLTPDDMSLGGAIEGIEAEVAAIVDAVMLMANNAAKQIRDNTAVRLEKYYTRRRREIWPTGTRD